jgi:hypothetical protein
MSAPATTVVTATAAVPTSALEAPAPTVVSPELENEIKSLTPLLQSMSLKVLSGSSSSCSPLVKQIMTQMQGIDGHGHFGVQTAKIMVLKQTLKALVSGMDEPLRTILDNVVEAGVPIAIEAVHQVYLNGRDSVLKEQQSK